MHAPPKRVFISYAHENDEYQNWVKQLAVRLREDGVESRLDDWHYQENDQIAEFMNHEIREADWVLVLCTPGYQAKIRDTEDGKRVAGSGWELRLLSSGMLVNNERKVLAVLARGRWADAVPDSLRGLVYFDLSTPKTFEAHYRSLLRRIVGAGEQPPPLGRVPPDLELQQVEPLRGPAPSNLTSPRGPRGFDLWRTLAGHGSDIQITQVAWSPTKELLASCADDGTIILWDVETGEQTRVLRGHRAPVYSLAWSPDGAVIASGSDDKTVRLWDPHTAKSLHTLKGHSDSVIALAWSPNGKRLASGDYDGILQLWNPVTGRKGSALGKDSGGIYGLAWSPDGGTLAAACYHRDIEIWNTRTGKLRFELRGIEGSSTFSLAWSPLPESSLLAAGFFDGTIRLWDGGPDSGFPSHDLHGHAAEVGALSFSHDGSLLISKSRDDTVRLWHPGTRKMLAVVQETTFEEWVGGIAFHPKRAVLATLGKEDTVIRIWGIDVPGVSRSEVSA